MSGGWGVLPGGGGTAIYELISWAPDGLYRYVPLSRAWFSSGFLWDRVYKSASLGLESTLKTAV